MEFNTEMSSERNTSQPTNGYTTEELREALKPLIPVSELDESDYPKVYIESSKLQALSLLAAERAKTGRGTIPDHERGICGEYAFCEYLPAPLTIDREIYDGGDQGHDIEFRGNRIDVKTVGPNPNNPFLPVSTYGELTADWYVLIQQVNRGLYHIIGCAHRAVVKRSPTLTFTAPELRGSHSDEVYAVQQDYLHPIVQLLQ